MSFLGSCSPGRRSSLFSCFSAKRGFGLDEDGALPQARNKSPSAAAQQLAGACTQTSCKSPMEGSRKVPCSSTLMTAFPLSWAVLTSDAREVLDLGFGSDPVAAQALQQVHQSMSSSSGSNSKDDGTSFLAMLLGSEMEEAALKCAQMGRSWKGTTCMQLLATAQGTTCMQLLATAHPPESSAQEEEQGPKEVATFMGTEGVSGISLRPIQPSRNSSMGSLSAGLDEKGSRGGVNGSTKSVKQNYLQSEPMPCKSLERSGSKGTFGGLSDSFVGNAKPARWRLSELSPSLDCSAFHDASMHTSEVHEQGHMKKSTSSLALCSSPHGEQLNVAQSPGNRLRRSSLRMSERDIERLMCESGNESPTNLRTRALLKSLSVPEERSPSPMDIGKAECMMPRGKSYSDLTQCATLEDEVQSLGKVSEVRAITRELRQPQGNSAEATVHNFDVVVSLSDPLEGKRSPLTVVITDSTEHVKARTVLTTLAESQLAILSNIMPQHVIQFLAMESSENNVSGQHVGQLARAHESATLMFMDICGFTAMSKEVEPVEVMNFLNNLFSHFDELVDIHGVHKVETAGDCYIVSGGIMKQALDENGFGQIVGSHNPAESAHRVMEFAKAILHVAGQVLMPNTQQPTRIRIGMHTGDVVSGMIGTKLPKFSLFGDAINTAARMESTGVPGQIHVSKATRALLTEETWVATGGIEAKGKGWMESYLWIPKSSRSSSQGFDAASSISQCFEPQKPIMQGNTSPLAAISPAVRLFGNPQSSHEAITHDLPQEISGQSCLETKATSSSFLKLEAKATRSSLLPAKILKATQTLSQSLYKIGGSPPPAVMASVTLPKVRGPKSSTPPLFSSAHDSS